MKTFRETQIIQMHIFEAQLICFEILAHEWYALYVCNSVCIFSHGATDLV